MPPEVDVVSPNFIELALQLGIAVLLFGALIIYGRTQKQWIRSEQERWNSELALREKKNLIDKETWEKKNQNDKEMLTSLIEKNYSILNNVMSDSREQIQVITRLVERIKAMQSTYDQAFHDLFTKHDGHDKDRCIHHIKGEFRHS